MRTLIHAFLCVAAVGFVLSLIVHLLSLLGIVLPFGSAVFALHIGIFVVWLPTILISQNLTKQYNRNEFWKLALRDCPPWMRFVTMGCGYYAFINFAIFIFLAPPKGQVGATTPPIVVRGFSGHWMAFYAVAFAVMYSHLHHKDDEPQ